MSNVFESAVVTGASSGIGEAFCHALAPRCRRILAVARRGDRLNALRRELSSLTDLEPLELDLREESDVLSLSERLPTWGVDLLVNNAGIAIAGGFSGRSLADQLAMTRLHVLAPLMLTHAAVNVMKGSGRGFIINVSSLTVFDPLPASPVYAATKAFIQSLSRSLHEELGEANIYVQSLHPGWTTTELLKTPAYTDSGRYEALDPKSIPQGLWAEPSFVAQASLEGLDEGRCTVIPGRVNQKIAETGLFRYREHLRPSS